MAKKSGRSVKRQASRKGRRVQRQQSRQPELPAGVMAALQQEVRTAVGFRPFELATADRVRLDTEAVLAGRPLLGAFGT